MKSKQYLRSRCSTGVPLFSHQDQQAKFPPYACSRTFRNLFSARYLFIFSLILASPSMNLYAGTLIYTIEEGDTLESIAQRFKVSVATLTKINRFRSMEEVQESIVRGQSILIPESDIVLASVGAQGIKMDTEIQRAQVRNPVTKHESLPEGQAENSRVPIRSPVTSQVATQATYQRTDTLGNSHEYQVQAGDTLSSLAIRFNQSSARIQKLNGLDSSYIRIGQILRIPNEGAVAPEMPRTESARSYTVEKGDTLLGISRKTKVSIGVIRALNQLEDDYIRPGQLLRISTYEQAVRAIAENRHGSEKKQESEGDGQPGDQAYSVKRGDTLSSISRQFNISLEQLLEWNQIGNADKLGTGQKLIIRPLSTYTVEEGDTLWSIARYFGLRVAELRSYNSASGELLRPGQTLRVGKASRFTAQNPASESRLAPPNVYESKEEEEAASRANEEETAYQQLKIRKRQRIDINPPASLPQAPNDKDRPIDLNAYFMRNSPRVPRQPNASYYEEFTDDPLENYQTARRLLRTFDEEIATMPQLSNKLTGYSILIDPGHGGLDPGFNSQSEDGNGNPLYIIEDEYNYDYALRLYRQLKRNGAHVGLTILSPNHLIIDSPNASRTLVSQKNEIYNSPFINQRGEYRSWPIGTPAGLHKRVEVAESFYNGTAKSQRIFISLHNDNSPWDNDGRLVLYYNDSLTIDKLGRQMAESLLPHLGENSHVRGQNLAVLRKNPARYAVLVELRNIAYPRNSWAIRNADLRQEDTDMLTNSILSFVQSLKK